MAIIDFTLEQAKQLTDKLIQKRRPPVEARDQVDLSFRLDKQSIVVYEIREIWNQPGKKQEIHIAKATYVKARKIWKIQWQKAGGKWHSYTSLPEVSNIADFLKELDKDPYSCFWG